jgi:hypothetical protein
MRSLLQSGFVCLVALLAAGCSGPRDPMNSASAVSPKEFLVPAKIPIKLERILYEYNPPSGNLMGDGCAIVVGIIEHESFRSFVAEHASKEIEWYDGPFHIGSIGIDGDEYVSWLSRWLDAKVTKDLGKVVDWKALLRSGGPDRYYRIRYEQREVDSFGKRVWTLECAELWLIDKKSRIFVHLLVNT